MNILVNRNMRITEGWLDRVQVVHMDMRDFNPPVKADILVRFALALNWILFRPELTLDFQSVSCLGPLATTSSPPSAWTVHSGS